MSSKELRLRKNEFIRKFIDNTCDIFKTCEETNTQLFEFYQWLKNDKNFKAQIEFAREIVFDQMESRIFQRALTNPNLGLKVLERWRPERWGDIHKLGKEAKHEVESILPREFYFISTEQFKELFDSVVKQSLNVTPGAGEEAGIEDKFE